MRRSATAALAALCTVAGGATAADAGRSARSPYVVQAGAWLNVTVNVAYVVDEHVQKTEPCDPGTPDSVAVTNLSMDIRIAASFRAYGVFFDALYPTNRAFHPKATHALILKRAPVATGTKLNYADAASSGSAEFTLPSVLSSASSGYSQDCSPGGGIPGKLTTYPTVTCSRVAIPWAVGVQLADPVAAADGAWSTFDAFPRTNPRCNGGRADPPGDEIHAARPGFACPRVEAVERLRPGQALTCRYSGLPHDPIYPLSQAKQHLTIQVTLRRAH